MHIVGFDLVSFWLGFIVGSVAMFIFIMVLATSMAKHRKKTSDEILRKEFPELYKEMKEAERNEM